MVVITMNISHQLIRASRSLKLAASSIHRNATVTPTTKVSAQHAFIHASLSDFALTQHRPINQRCYSDFPIVIFRTHMIITRIP